VAAGRGRVVVPDIQTANATVRLTGNVMLAAAG